MKSRRILSWIKGIVVNVIAHSLYYSGILFILKNKIFNDKIIVFTYHRIIPRKNLIHSFSHESIIIDTDLFKQQLNFLKKHFKIHTISSLVNHLNSGKEIEGQACLITMDDGWIDNYLYAFPTLKNLNIPSTIFLPINYVGSDKPFWQEKLSRALYQITCLKSEEAYHFLDKLGLDNIDLMPSSAIKARIKFFIFELKQHPYSEIESIINSANEIIDLESIDYELDRYMNWVQVQEMSKNGISFGSHACSHRILTRISEQEVDEELKTSASRIMQINPDIPLTIAYPNGNSNSKVHKIAQDNQYVLGFGTKNGYISNSENRFDIKRINVNTKTSSNNPLFLFSLILDSL